MRSRVISPHCRDSGRCDLASEQVFNRIILKILREKSTEYGNESGKTQTQTKCNTVLLAAKQCCSVCLVDKNTL